MQNPKDLEKAENCTRPSNRRKPSNSVSNSGS